MLSKIMMVRSYARSLIQTHIRPAPMISTQPPVGIYTGPNAKPVSFGSGFCSDAAGGGNSELDDAKNEDYDSDDMKFVFEGADDDNDVNDDDESDDYIPSEDDTDASDDDRGRPYDPRDR